MLHGPRHRLEQPHVIFAGGGLTVGGAQLGKKSTELGSPRRLQLLEQVRDDAVAERVHPRAERQDLLTFVTATHEDMATAVARLPHERVD